MIETNQTMFFSEHRQSKRCVLYVQAFVGRSICLSMPCCVICMEDDEAAPWLTIPTCGHRFHFECLAAYQEHRGLGHVSCPMCRSLYTDEVFSAFCNRRPDTCRVRMSLKLVERCLVQLTDETVPRDEMTLSLDQATALYRDTPWSLAHRPTISYASNVVRIVLLCCSLLHTMNLSAQDVRVAKSKLHVLLDEVSSNPMIEFTEVVDNMSPPA